jgi:hypothetical protein
MVTVIGYKPVEKEDGTVFFKLQLQGGAEPVMSQSTGKYYLTARTCSIPTTFNENECKRLVGTNLQGSIIKVQTDEYDYKVPETGELISLTHRWEYDPYGLASEDNKTQPVRNDMEFA